LIESPLRVRLVLPDPRLARAGQPTAPTAPKEPMMTSKTVALALALSMAAIPAFADCPGHEKISSDQTAATSPTERPAPEPSLNS